MEKSNIRSYDDQRSIGYVSVAYIDVLGCALLRKTMYAYDIGKVYGPCEPSQHKIFLYHSYNVVPCYILLVYIAGITQGQYLFIEF